ncbi:GNAT family N-acetyltransferase [Nocardia transvalensis]|uniref:GNAT family N-acetyltransferase n=1 Tax=Nocardia transvalensis TaxID=37333 RepID=UPI0018941957|nr:GNAT family protein [Nocardia transvalensis]MBF6331425.1 GNAT family N-acetyltransferase [Nocardia transvalensis]
MSDSPPRLGTCVAGLVLRELTVADASEYYAVLDRNREHLSRFGDYQQEKAATPEWVVGYFSDPPDGNIRYGIRYGEQLVGRVDLNPVDPPRYGIGYWLDEQHTGRGYAMAACAAVIDHARTLGATEIYAGVTHGNHKSVAVLDRLGFRPVAEFPTHVRYRLTVRRSQPIGEH